VFGDQHTYGPEVWVRKPHYFFAAAFDPCWDLGKRQAPPPLLAGLPAGHVLAAEVQLVEQVLCEARDLLTETGRWLAGKGIVMQGHLPAARALRLGIRAVRGWRHDQAAACVQQHWRRCVADPSFRVCRARLLREIEDDLGCV
jgi:hypothetical protein